LLQRLAAKASYVVAVGQCSSFGGIPAARGNVTGAIPVRDALKEAAVSTKHPIINIPGCPANPDWTLVTLATLLQGVSVTLTRKSGEKGTLFGSVTAIDIAEKLAAQGYVIDKRKIALTSPLKVLGEYDVPIKLHRDVTALVKVRVEGEGEPKPQPATHTPAPAPAPAKEAEPAAQ
jgi:hypothetical protein